MYTAAHATHEQERTRNTSSLRTHTRTSSAATRLRFSDACSLCIGICLACEPAYGNVSCVGIVTVTYPPLVSGAAVVLAGNGGAGRRGRIILLEFSQ